MVISFYSVMRPSHFRPIAVDDSIKSVDKDNPSTPLSFMQRKQRFGTQRQRRRVLKVPNRDEHEGNLSKS